MALARLVRPAGARLSIEERFLALWALVVLVLVNADRLHLPWLPFGEQMITTLAPPLCLLAVGLAAARAWRGPALVALVAACVPGSVAVTALNLGRTGDATLYVSRDELAALAWLEENGSPKDVVLSTYATGNRVARRSGLLPVLGHWSATPDMGRLVRAARRFYGGELSPDEAAAWLDELSCRFVVEGPNERRIGDGASRVPGIERVYSAGGFAIFERLAAGYDRRR